MSLPFELSMRRCCLQFASTSVGTYGRTLSRAILRHQDVVGSTSSAFPDSLSIVVYGQYSTLNQMNHQFMILQILPDHLSVTAEILFQRFATTTQQICPGTSLHAGDQGAAGHCTDLLTAYRPRASRGRSSCKDLLSWRHQRRGLKMRFGCYVKLWMSPESGQKAEILEETALTTG